MNSRFKLFVATSSVCLAILLLVGAHLGKSAPAEGSAYRQMQVFTEVLHRIKSDYVEEPDLRNVTLGALNGLLESIDPFASYLNAEQYKHYLKNKDAAQAGVGLVLSKRYGYVNVVSTFVGSPAAKSGLTTGDLIESINGVATRDMPLAYAEVLLRGKAGSTVEISISPLLRMRQPEPQKITLTRAFFPVPAVTARMLEDRVGYVRPETLVAGKAKEVAAAVRNLEKQGARGFVLDLRQCAVGTPEEGVALADLFLDKGLMTYVEGQQRPRQNFKADPATTITHLPLVITTNRGTADGAEITATALLENERAQVVGERTFGDAAVRQAISMEDGGAIILSVAKYYSPQGKAIQDTGVVPSVPLVEYEPLAGLQEEEEVPEHRTVPKAQEPEEDNLLKKAIEVLTQGKPETEEAQPGPPARTIRPGTDPFPLTVPKPQQ
jgi:carboxyl-terminal processing protease